LPLKSGEKTYGLVVKVAGITQDFTDGTTTNTGRGLDVAISQNGFFRLVDSNGSVFYSRNGQFKLDENRNLVNMQGLQLTGYPATGTPPTIQQVTVFIQLKLSVTAVEHRTVAVYQ
ncbi:flagellar hook-basal body complex protein, partial [Escherichia sp. R-CC3]